MSSKGKRRSTVPLSLYEQTIDASGLTEDDMEEQCTNALLRNVAGIADFRDVWKKDPWKIFKPDKVNDEVDSIEEMGNSPLCYLTRWKKASGVKCTQKLLVKTLVDVAQADLASKICKKIAKEKETAAGATGEPKPAVPVKKEEEPAATDGTTSGKKVPVKKGKGTMEAEEVKELKGKLNGMKHQIEMLSEKINGIIEGLPADPE